MERGELDFVISRNNYLAGGTKEACVKIRDFIRKISYNEGSLFVKQKTEEFIESTRILMAFSFRQEDTVPKEKAKLSSLLINISEDNALVGGTYNAIENVSSFLHLLGENLEEIVDSPSSVKVKEFIQSVKVLIYYSINQPDQVPVRWRCDNDCYMVSWILCPGECNIDKSSSKLCGCYIEES